MMNNDVVDTLNDLIETCKDGEEGFRTCAESISNPQYKQSLTKRAAGCATAAQELRTLVVTHGGDPETSGSVAGSLHRRWVDIKSAVVGRDDVAVLSECERGEDVAKKRYREALEKDLPSDVKSVVEQQYQGVLQNHDDVKAWRDAAKVAAA